MGLYNLFGLDRHSVLTGLTENVSLTENMSDHEDKKDLVLNSDMEESCICAQLDEDIFTIILYFLQKNK